MSRVASATTVLPLPTSPWSSRDIGFGLLRSAMISSITLFWAPVNEKGRVLIQVCRNERSISSGLPGWLSCHWRFCPRTPS